MFDNQYRPSILIAPSHLDYFFHIEQYWQDTFRETPHAPPPRTPPSVVSYYTHCEAARRDMVLDSSRGGMYTVYMDDEIPTRRDGGTIQVQYESQWHGDPMAMVYRAIQAAQRIVWPKRVPESMRDQLLALYALYEQGNKLQKSLYEEGGSQSDQPAHSIQTVDSSQPGQPSGIREAASWHQCAPSQTSPDAPPTEAHEFIAHDLSVSRLPLSPPPTASPTGNRKRSRQLSSNESSRKRIRLNTPPVYQPELKDMVQAKTLQQVSQCVPARTLKQHAEAKFLDEGEELHDGVQNLRATTANGISSGTLTAPPSSTCSAKCIGQKRRRIWRWGPQCSAEMAMRRWKELYI
jgi:hypothetical protein